MRHYVTFPSEHLTLAKKLAASMNDPQSFPMCGGPRAWILKVEEATAVMLVAQIPGATCKTLPTHPAADSEPDPVVDYMKRNRGKLGPDNKLVY